MNKLINISEAVSLAIHSCAYLALDKNKNRNISASEISTVLEASVHHISKILQRLVKANIIFSLRGRNGGFLIKKNCKQIFLIEIYEAVEGKFPINNCLFFKKVCKGNDCIFTDFLKETNHSIKKYFKNTTIENLKNILANKI